MLESGVTGAANDEGLLKPVAYVVLKDGRDPSPELARELQEFVKTNTAPHKYPAGGGVRRQLPKTATGKIKRFELRHRAAARRRAAHAAATEPQTKPDPKATSSTRWPGRIMPACRASSRAMGSEAEAMLPYSSTFT